MGSDSTISPIGLDFGEDAVRAIQVRKAADQLAVLALFELPFDAEPAEIRRAFRKAGFVGNTVVTNVKNADTSFRTMRLAPVADAELATAAHWQSARQLDIDSQCFQSRILHSTTVTEKEQERREVIVLAVTNKVIESKLRMLDSIGLHTHAVDATPCAIHHALHFLYPTAFESPVIVIVPGETKLTLSIVNEGQIQFLRSLDVSIAELSAINTGSVAQASLDPLEKAELQLNETSPSANQDADGAVIQAPDHSDPLTNLSREVNKSIHHFAVAFNSSKPQDGLILGAHEKTHGLANALSRMTNIPFEKVPAAIWSNVHGFDEHNVSGDPMAWAAALGLTLHQDGSITERGAA